MKRTIKPTADGSKTLFINELNENYHSHHGALQEAKHVFIDNGLNQLDIWEINILELGFGTGLNVLVTFDEFLRKGKYFKIRYFTLEKYPISSEEVSALDYSDLFLDERTKNSFQKIHELPWEMPSELAPGFELTKFQCDFTQLPQLSLPEIHLVYYDCFGARVQPDLWEKPLFTMTADKMKVGGLLTTYSSKGSVRRILEELNFNVEKKQGPPGKREMINAWKQPLSL